MDDVVIVGAGPTGLLLAGDLAAAGVGCTVLERRADVSRLSRAFAVHARTLETRRGADRDGGDRRTSPASRFPFVLVTPQCHTERVLQRRAQSLGARVVRGCEVTAVGQDAGGVEVETAGTHRRAAAR